MAKKSVASLQTGSKRLTKAIKMVKKDGSNSYSFVEKIIDPKFAKDWLAGKPIIQPVITAKPSNANIENESVTKEKVSEGQPLKEEKISEEQSVKKEKVSEGKPLKEEKVSEEQPVTDGKNNQTKLDEPQASN